jgi:hypothetical protein
MSCLYIEIWVSTTEGGCISEYFLEYPSNLNINSTLTHFHRKVYPVLKVSNQNKLQNYINLTFHSGMNRMIPSCSNRQVIGI